MHDFNPEVGCIILNALFVFQRDRWIPLADAWSPNIVAGKGFDTQEPDGRRLWALVRERLDDLEARALGNEPHEIRADDEPRLGRRQLTRGRLGQGAFRVLVTRACQRRCALTGERTLPVLPAAHLPPFKENGPKRTSNGLLLRSDLHIPFDQGYLTVTPEHRIEVNRRIKDEFDNGRDDDPLHGRRLVIEPSDPAERPAREFLESHNREVFAG